MEAITDNCKEKLVEFLCNCLDSRDKRYMFLRLEFPKVISHIQLDGSAHYVSWQIIFEFENRNMLGSLIATLNAKLGANLDLETK